MQAEIDREAWERILDSAGLSPERHIRFQKAFFNREEKCIEIVIDGNGERYPFLMPKDEPSYLQIFPQDLDAIDLSDTSYILTNGMMLFQDPAATSIEAFLRDHVMDIHGKGLESVRQRYLHPLDLGTLFDQRLVACESEVDDLTVILDRLLDVRIHEQFEFIKARYTPYDIIAEPYVIERFIHLGDAA